MLSVGAAFRISGTIFASLKSDSTDALAKANPQNKHSTVMIAIMSVFDMLRGACA